MILSDQDKRNFDNAEKPGGITTVGCLFCKDMINASREYVDNFDQISWKMDGCQWGTCPFFNTPGCLENFDDAVRRNPTTCPFRNGRGQ
jgi:hypothetical protein